jgi:DNA-binding CsgD family transcriptional regulator
MAEMQSQSDRKLASELLHFTNTVEKYDTPGKVFDALHEATWGACHLAVLGALLLPIKIGDVDSLELGKTVFLHKSVPRAWWEEELELARVSLPAPGMLAYLALAPFTLTEAMQQLELLGSDRWPVELALKYGMRDRLLCPVGGRWLVVYWSKNVLNPTPEQRALLFMGASFAAIRLQKLVVPSIMRVGKGAALTPRELAVLRLLSNGKRMAETSKFLGLGEETVRSHLKKAQTKLGVRDRAQAVAQAIRLRLIP